MKVSPPKGHSQDEHPGEFTSCPFCTSATAPGPRTAQASTRSGKAELKLVPARVPFYFHSLLQIGRPWGDSPPLLGIFQGKRFRK